MLDALRLHLEELLEAVAREELDLAIGEPRHARVGALHQGASELFALSRLSEVQRELSAVAGEDAKRVRFLLAALAEGRGTCAAAGELDEYVTWRVHAHVPVGDSRVPLGGVAGALAAGPDNDSRHASEITWLEALDGQEPLLEGAFSAYRRAVEELGYGDFPRSWGVLTGIDLAGLAGEARRFLDDTSAPYFELLDRFLPKIVGMDRADATAADALRLERAEPFDRHFSGEGPHGWASRLMGASGYDPAAGGRLRLHALPGGSRAAGASVYFVRVPEEIVVLHGHRGGRSGRAALLRGIGTGGHAAHSTAGLPMEFRLLGEASVPHAFGLLFESLLMARSVLQRQLGVPREDAGELIRLGTFIDLLGTRASAARFLFELWWHTEPDAAERGPRYAEELTAATGLRHDPRAALAESVPPFRSAQELRARQLGEVLSIHLRERCDEDWNRNPRAAGLLTNLMAPGRTFTADELAVQLGASGLSLDRLRKRAEEALR